MNELKYYLSIFLRRLHYFLVVAVAISTAAVIVAFALPPAYESQTRLLMEAPQIPRDLAATTVNVGTREQLEIIEQRLMTRANLLEVARNQQVFANMGAMSADQIVAGMRARTTIQKPGRRSPAPIMSLSFQARAPQITSGVLNAYLTLIERQNVEFRTQRAGNTQEFFEQEVERLGQDLDTQSARILEFKTRNAGALPGSLDFRLSKQNQLQEQLRRIDREITAQRTQADRLVEVFEATGQFGEQGPRLSPDEERLRKMRGQLDEALSIYSETSPRVRVLKARIAQLEERIETRAQSDDAAEAAEEDDTAPPSRGEVTLELQLSEIETRIDMLQERREETEARLSELTETLEETPANTVALEELQRAYANIEKQYNTAVDRLARASTGERIETLSRGQRLSVIEPPATPTRPTKPDRLLIAGGGTAVGIGAGLALVLLIELLNRTARRSEDIVSRLGVRPLATIPYMPSGGEVLRKRLLKTAVYLTILLGLPAAVYAVHLYYLPLDLLADKAMNMIGVRW